MEGVLNQLVLEHLQLAPLHWGEYLLPTLSTATASPSCRFIVLPRELCACVSSWHEPRIYLWGNCAASMRLVHRRLSRHGAHHPAHCIVFWMCAGALEAGAGL